MGRLPLISDGRCCLGLTLLPNTCGCICSAHRIILRGRNTFSVSRTCSLTLNIQKNLSSSSFDSNKEHCVKKRNKNWLHVEWKTILLRSNSGSMCHLMNGVLWLGFTCHESATTVSHTSMLFLLPTLAGSTGPVSHAVTPNMTMSAICWVLRVPASGFAHLKFCHLCLRSLAAFHQLILWENLLCTQSPFNFGSTCSLQ